MLLLDFRLSSITSLEDRCWSTGHDVPLHTCRPRRADDPWLTVSDRPSSRHLARTWPDPSSVPSGHHLIRSDLQSRPLAAHSAIDLPKSSSMTRGKRQC